LDQKGGLTSSPALRRGDSYRASRVFLRGLFGGFLGRVPYRATTSPGSPRCKAERKILVSVKCHLLGVVLNAVDSNAADYYYSYRCYPYSYGYSRQESEGSLHPDDPVDAVFKAPSRDRDDTQEL
jgi:hypothetical protein